VIFNQIVKPEQELAFRQYMMKYEVYSLRWTALIAISYMLLMLVVDNWRVESYGYSVFFRGILLIVLGGVLVMTYRGFSSIRLFYWVNAGAVTALITITFLLDYKAGLPPYSMPNALCLYFYTCNAALGYPLRVKTIQTFIFFAFYCVYSTYLSPHPSFHTSQIWNLFINASISPSVGFLIERYKRISFVRQEELKNARMRIEELNNLKTKLISVLSHDMSSPINSLKGLLNLRTYNLLSDQDMNQYADHLNKALENVSSMLQNLLRWSRLQMDGFSPDKQLIQLDQLINEVINSVEHVAQPKNVTIQNHVRHVDPVKVDPEVLKLVTRNLLTNAIKFSPDGSLVRVTSTLEANQLKLSIHDAGVGIPAHELKNVFTLSKISTLGTNQEAGTGIGLMLTKEFLEMMDGSISVESVEGKGSVFSAYFPMHQ
jgi:signal transduction histidine kinase